MQEDDLENAKEVALKILTLYGLQTQDEKYTETTRELNGVGFNAVDAPFMSSIAEQILEKNFITMKQVGVAKQVLIKYKSQLESLAPYEPLQHSTLNDLRVVGIGHAAPKSSGTLRVAHGKLLFKPNVYPSAQIKTLGFTWGGNDVGWIGKISLENISGVKAMFSDLMADPTVDEYLATLSKPLELSDVVAESPLYAFQKKGSAFMTHYERVLVGLKPGRGKSAAAILAAEDLQAQRILVICPLSLCLNWKKEINKWCGRPAVIWHGSVNTWDSYDRWVVTNYNTVVNNYEDIINQNFDVVICDESVLLKNRDTSRVKQIKKVCKNPRYVWFLSGSPITKFYDDMWAQLNILDHGRFSSYWKFARSYCSLETNQWGTAVVGNQPDAYSRIMENFRDIYFTIPGEEDLDLPPWIFQDIEIQMGNGQDELYAQMEREFVASLPDGDEVLSPNVLSQMLRLVQIASNPILIGGANDGAKWKALEEMLQWVEFPIIIWTNFIKTAHYIAAILEEKNIKVAALTGSTSTDDRQTIVDMFQNGELSVIVAHPGVGKFGLTLTKARTAVYLERSFNGDDYYQSLYRIRRIGTTQSPTVIHLLACREDGGQTIDHVIHQVLDYRRESAIQITSSLVREVLKKGGLNG
jgi:SWI/SNF-related matrix-associated actin-dependent regulator 1 of chromatin subfamily A